MHFSFTKRAQFKPVMIGGIGIVAVLGIVIGGRALYQKFSTPEQMIGPEVTEDWTPVTKEEDIILTQSDPKAPKLTNPQYVPILMYHYIEHVKDENDTKRKQLDILPEVLDSQLKTLTDAGYTFLYMSDIATLLDTKQKLPSKAVVLTFDDGYQDFYTDALPVLKKYHAKSTAYIISGVLGKPNYMTKDQLRSVIDSGIVEIGAHTIHHPDLPHIPAARAHEEIFGSREQLQKLFSLPVNSFAYPSGRLNDDIVKMVAAAGYTTAVSTKPGTAFAQENRLVLYRLRPGARTGSALIKFLTAVVGKS